MKGKHLFRYIFHDIKMKFLFVAIPLAFIALFALVTVSLSSFEKIFKDKISDVAQGELVQNANQLETIFLDMFKLGNIIGEDEVILSALKSSSEQEIQSDFRLKDFSSYQKNDYKRMAEIERRLASLQSTFFFNYEVSSIIYSADGVSAGTLSDPVNGRNIILNFGKIMTTMPWYDQLAQSPNGIIFEMPFQYPSDLKERKFLTMVKAIYDHYHHHILGILVINIDTVNLNNLGEATSNRNLYLYNQDMIPVYEYTNFPVSFNISEHTQDSLKEKTLELKEKTYLINSFPLERFGLRLFSIIDYSSFGNELFNIQKTLLIWMLVIFLLYFAFLILYVAHLTKPLTQLIEKLKNKKIGPYSLSEKIEYKTDDIKAISNSFEQLFSEVEALTQTILSNQRREYDLKYEMLKAQINPHFIFNTLNVIKWTAIMEHNEKTAEMIADLGLLMEASMNRGEEEIPLSKEIELLRSYLSIQNIRFANHITLTVDIDPAILNCTIIKLILQPIVENSVVHGFNQTKQGDITISAEQFNSDIVIEITDNGTGIEPEILQSLLSPSNKPTSDFNGIGIYNIHERLRLKYGSQYGLSVFSNATGTTVKIRIPKKEE